MPIKIDRTYLTNLEKQEQIKLYLERADFNLLTQIPWCGHNQFLKASGDNSMSFVLSTKPRVEDHEVKVFLFLSYRKREYFYGEPIAIVSIDLKEKEMNLQIFAGQREKQVFLTDLFENLCLLIGLENYTINISFIDDPEEN